jgi:molybdopterin molybdotransferase
LADLLSVDDALERVLESIHPLPSETVDLMSALGRALTEDIVADTNIPPFANSSMDGYAVRAGDLGQAQQDSPTRLAVVMDIPAGVSPQRPIAAGEAARIMTGAPLPQGADAVIPVENTDARWTAAAAAPLEPHVQIYRSVKPGDHVRPIGEDIRVGQVVLKAGSIVRAQEIGVLASIGRSVIPVRRQPRIAILSSGDELVGITAPLTPGKIRDSNSYMLAALVATYSCMPIRIPPAHDTLEDVRRCFHEALDQKPDIILSSAGVSVGAFDVVRSVIDELGSVNFWRINLRPGKPLAYGQVGGVPFFGLPGNPVSAMVTFDIFVRPVLLKLAGLPTLTPTIQAATAEDLRSDGRRTYLRVRLENKDGQWAAHLTGTQSSGALTSMVLADGLLIVPENVTELPAGSLLPVRLLRDH